MLGMIHPLFGHNTSAVTTSHPTFRSAGSTSFGTIASMGTSASPGKPSVSGLGGIMLAVLIHWSSDTPTCATSGWTKIDQVSEIGGGGTNDTTQSLWWAPESAAAPVFNWTTTAPYMAQVSYYADSACAVYTDFSIRNVGSGNGAISGTIGAVTSPADESLMFAVIAARGNSGVPDSITSGWTRDTPYSGTANNQIVFASKVLASGTGASSGSFTDTGSSSFGAWGGWIVQLTSQGFNLPPSSTTIPSVTSASGFYAVGDTLTGTAATFARAEYASSKWQRDGVDIVGATGASYTLTSTDLTHTITYVSVATNSLGSTTSASAGIGPIANPGYTQATRQTSDGTTRLTSDGTTRKTTVRTS